MSSVLEYSVCICKLFQVRRAALFGFRRESARSLMITGQFYAGP